MSISIRITPNGRTQHEPCHETNSENKDADQLPETVNTMKLFSAFVFAT